MIPSQKSRYTPLGIVPDDWQMKRLSALATISYGISKPIDKSLKDGIPLIGMPNVTKDGRFRWEERFFVDPAAVRTADYLRPMDILFNWRNGSKDHLGKTVLFYLRGRFTHVGFLLRIRCGEQLVPQYCDLYIKAIKDRGYFLKAKIQVNNTFNKEELSTVPIVLPPVPEQQKIAAILGTWDVAIEKTGQLIEAKRKLKKALCQQLLTGKRRFKEFSDALETVRLGKLFQERNETGYAHLPLLSISGSDGISHRDDLERRDTSNADKSAYLRICPDDIGYNTMRMWQGVSAVSRLEGIVSPAYTVCIPDEKRVDPKFMGYLFKFHPVVFLFYRHSQGLVSDTWNLKFHHFAEIKVTIPSLAEQKNIASVLSACDAEIASLQSKMEALQTQKKGLMQKLLTGKIRVKV